jgi:hypothetical protein
MYNGLFAVVRQMIAVSPKLASDAPKGAATGERRRREESPNSTGQCAG